VALVLVKLAQLAADLPEIRELDINPLLADETGALAFDARVAIAPVEPRFKGSGNPRFAVRPYIAKVALNFAAGAITPRQFGPTIRSPFSRAARSAASANEPVPWPSPAVKIIAAATPRPAAAATIPGTEFRRRGDDRDVGRRIDRVDTCGRRKALDLAMMWVDERNRTRKAPCAEIAKNRAAHRALARGSRPPRRPSAERTIFRAGRSTWSSLSTAAKLGHGVEPGHGLASAARSSGTRAVSAHCRSAIEPFRLSTRCIGCHQAVSFRMARTPQIERQERRHAGVVAARLPLTAPAGAVGHFHPTAHPRRHPSTSTEISSDNLGLAQFPGQKVP
jgi:hypothetical protein